MANDNVFKYELEGLQSLLSQFESGGTSALSKLAKYSKDIQEDLAEIEEKRKEDMLKKLAELQLKGIISNEKEAARLTEAEYAKQKSYKLQNEIEILKTISEANKKERDKELEYLEREKEIIQKRNEATTKAASKVAEEKALAQQLLAEAENLEKKLKIDKALDEKYQQRARQKQEAIDKLLVYEFGDKFKETFGQGIADLTAALGNPKQALLQQMEEVLLSGAKAFGKAITSSLNEVNNAISSYAKYQTSINARTQGVTSFSSIADNLNSIAFSPLINTEDLYSNLADLVSQGILTNVEQRAMFMTIKDSIAQTFDVNSASLNRMIRLQQNDSTAARLGMESYLNKFLNVYIENSEYLTNTFDSVASSLFEASAMLGASSGTGASLEFEYVVQKWLGTLTGLGLSDEAAQNIATAIGQLGSGDVDSLSSSNMQNLLVMGANKANLSYAELLTEGLDASDTNSLLKGVVEYLQEIANQGNNIVQSQLANVFGVSVSDLIAVKNVNESLLNSLYGNNLTYSNMYGELYDQFGQITSRMGVANILENLFSNLMYQTGMDIASNPATYALWKITDFIKSNTGGINIPAITAMGNGIDLNANVEDLMQMGIMASSMLGNIGNIISGVSSISNGKVLLEKLGINSGSAALKISGIKSYSSRESGLNTSETAYVGNTNSSAYKDSAINKATDESQAELDAKVEANEDDDPTYQLYNYLKDTVNLDVKVNSIISTLSDINSDNNKGFSDIYTSISKVIGNNGDTDAIKVSIITASKASATKSVNTLSADTFDSDMPVSIANTYNSKVDDVSNYLLEIDFSNNFTNLVSNVDKIVQYLENDTNSMPLSDSQITGLKQFDIK